MALERVTTSRKGTNRQGDFVSPLAYLGVGSHSSTNLSIWLNSSSGIRLIPSLSGNNRLTATVVGLSQIAHAALPSIVTRSG